MTLKVNLRALIVTGLVALFIPLLSGCPDPPITGPGGGPSSGASGTTNATGAGSSALGQGSASGMPTNY